MPETTTVEPSPPPARSRRVPASVAGIAVFAVVVLVVGVAVAAWRSGAGEGAAWAGRPVEPPITLPDLVLTDTEGRPYRLSEPAPDAVTLVYFGYLNCPDVCPIHLAVLSEALATLAGDVRSHIQVVFVTTDPERDTPADIRAYLDQFDPRFVGLTGTPDELAAAQTALRVPLSVAEPAAADGSYLVGHATQVIAFGTDGVARLAYPFGVRQADWARDLPRLVAGEQP